MKQDPELDRLLKTWQAPAPSPTFESDVLRRVRLARTEPDLPWALRWLAALDSRPLVAIATAAVVAVVVTLSAAPDATRYAGGIFRADSITGSYAHLDAEDAR